MKPNNPIENDALHRALREWEVEASLPPRFGEEVWRRIARGQSRGDSSSWQELLQAIETAFRHPAVVVCYVAILLLIGLSAGIAQARRQSVRMDQALEVRYVQSVDPFQSPRH